MKDERKSIYLDYAAATPLRAEVIKAMEPYWQEEFANAQSVHTPGREAATVVQKARESIAEALSVQSSEIIFTSGASEANSLAILGALRAAQSDGLENPAVLVSEIAHGSVRNLGKSHGDEVVVNSAAVDQAGQLQLKALEESITADTVVVSCSHANSEIGTVQPIAEIATIIDKYRKQHDSIYPLLHVDASQSGLYASIRPEVMKADLLTLNGQKLYGPKGVGLLWVRSGTPLSALFASSSRRLVGDYQRLRPGTPPTALLVGLAEAVTWAQKNHQQHTQTVTKLRDYLISSLNEAFPTGRINGHLTKRIAHNVSFTLPDTDHDYLATQLDSHGIAIATTSACQARQAGGSEVLEKINTQQALRISLGLETTQEELDYVITALKKLI